jgi:hypothetical protein
MSAPLVLGLVFTMGDGPSGGARDEDSPLLSLLQLISFVDPGVASVYALVVALCSPGLDVGSWGRIPSSSTSNPLPLVPIPNPLLQLIPLLDAGVPSSLFSSTTFAPPLELGLVFTILDDPHGVGTWDKIPSLSLGLG